MKTLALILSVGLSTAIPVNAATVTVEAGDTLSGIAKRTLGNADLWREICKKNKALILNCDLVPVGAVLELPTSTDPSGSGVVTGKSANLVDASADFSDSYWDGYWLKPTTISGVEDPTGGRGATRVESADKPEAPGMNVSGFLRLQPVTPGVYNLVVWLRSTGENIDFFVGMADEVANSAAVTVGNEWERVSITLTADKPLERVFQVFERTPDNPAWEIFGVEVTRVDQQ